MELSRRLTSSRAKRWRPRSAAKWEIGVTPVTFRDAFHEQTILAYEMNDKPLPKPYGAPLRLRVERHLGYKHAKFVMKIEAVESFAKIGDGHGSYWADQGYAWYAGI